jgi:hypothetical protein
LKELRETNNALKIIKKASLSNMMHLIEKAMPECNELISIFVKSIATAQENLRNEQKKKKISNRTASNPDA